MIFKPEKIIKRIIKAVGERQAVLVVGNWQEELIKGIREKQNSIGTSNQFSELSDNSFTRIITDYSFQLSFHEVRRLLLPTGKLIISANCEDSIFDKIRNLLKLKRDSIKEENIKKIKPKLLQDQIHDNGFLIDGYYGYPGGYLLMIAEIQEKEVTTLFNSDKQETIKICID